MTQYSVKKGTGTPLPFMAHAKFIPQMLTKEQKKLQVYGF
jgi:hypothetical protein